MNEKIQLTESQQKAADKIINWFINWNNDKKQIFTLAGYAGTGKTFLINYVINNLLKLKPSEVAFTAPTGKAANVLIQRGALEATTIHRLIYRRVSEKIETKVNDKVIISERYKFIKKESIPNYKLIVLDETSMVEEKIMDDLLSFGVPIICCGDPFQLPPPEGSSNKFLEDPDVILTEIIRQDSENQIIKLATLIREGRSLKLGNYGDVVIIPSNLLTESKRKYLLTKADQVICGTNKRRKELNTEIKEYLEMDTKNINKGEKVICLLNNWDIPIDDMENYYLVNGMIGYVEDFEESTNELSLIKFKPDFLDITSPSIIIDSGNFKDSRSYYDFGQAVYLMNDGKYEIKKELTKESTHEQVLNYLVQKRDAVIYEKLNFFDSAYCISCHKSQGAEWDNVVVFDESHVFKDQWRRWLYTAITRAKKKLVIII